jgi:hypothetical protein
LPDTEVAVDESVVEEEDGVSGRRIHILHDGTDTVVTPGVCSAFRASSHVGVGGAGVAAVDHLCVRIYGFAVVIVTGEAVSAVSGAWANVEGETGEFLASLLVL